MTGSTIIQQNINILDETLKLYGDISYITHLMGLNPSFNNITDSLSVNSVVIYDDFVINEINDIIPPIVPVSNYFNYKGVENQNIFDIATRFYGSIDNIIDLMINNPSIDTITQSMKNISLNVLKTSNNINVVYYNTNNSLLTTDYINPFIGRAFNRSFNISFH